VVAYAMAVEGRSPEQVAELNEWLLTTPEERKRLRDQRNRAAVASMGGVIVERGGTPK